MHSPEARPIDQPSGAALQAGIDPPLPRRLAVGGGTAMFLAGWCYAPDEPLASLSVRVGDTAAAPLAFGLPRRVVGPRGAPDGASRSGFWALVPIRARSRRDRADLALEATLRSGRREQAIMASIELEPATASQGPPEPAGAEVAICLATHEPPADLFVRQVESIIDQTHTSWTCVVSDDASSPAARAAIRAALGDDPRFRLVEHDRRAGFYGNFERALRLAPPDASFVALADQDDRWHPEKLATLRGAIGDANLAYSDARIVDRDGRVLSPTYWSRRPNNYTDLASLALANTVSGAAALYRRELLDLALPFPPAHCRFFHDHWLALCALASGRIAYVDRPLYDYVQHRASLLGHERAHAWAARRRHAAARARHFIADPGYFHDHWRATYFTEYCRIAVMAQTLLLRLDNRLQPPDRRTLERLVAADDSARAIGWLAARRAKRLLGTDETLGAEGRLLRAFLWRQLLERVSGRMRRPPRWLPGDAAFEGRPMTLPNG